MKPELTSIDQMAAEWLTRHEQGLSERQQVEFARWLASNSRHAEIFQSMQRSWSRLDALRGSRIADRLEVELQQIPAAITYPLVRRARVRLQPWISGAVAAGIVWCVAFFAWWRPHQAGAPYAETAATDIGMVRELKLPDGSIVQLNTNTAVEVLFTKSERRVRLGRGEALFTVAKIPARPFIVSAGGVDVRAVGTEFNVRLHAGAIEVVVREGKVRVDDAANGESLLAQSVPASPPVAVAAPILSAGHRVLIPVASAPAPKPSAIRVDPVPVASLEIDRSLAWRNRRLVFESAPLALIVAEFNRYNRRQLLIVDEELAARRFGGTFDTNDVRTFVELLRNSYDVLVEERAGETILTLPQ